MKYVIDEEVCKAHNLKVEEVFCLLACKSCDNIFKLVMDMQDRELLSKIGPSPFPTQHWDDEVCSVLLESDKTVPVVDRCKNLAAQLRELFPKGLKVGSSAWRGNVREITLRLQKFFKVYDYTNWTDEEILEATKRYIDHFNGNYTYMRILKYFIMKSDKVTSEDGTVRIEDKSELATWLENDTEEENSDWTSTLV